MSCHGDGYLPQWSNTLVTVKNLKIRIPEKIAVILLKDEQFAFMTEQCAQKLQTE